MEKKNIDISIENLTKEILQLKKQTVENMIKIGKKLIEVKQVLPHGKFGEYLKENVDISTRSANNYMKVVTKFSNSQTFANLEPSKLVILLDVPKDNIDEFSKENDLETMSCREIRKNIKKLKKSLKHKKETIKNELKESKQQEQEKTYSENNNSNYDEDGSYNPFKNFKSKDYESFFKDFDFDQFKQKTLMLDMSEEEKKTLKKFYNILAKQVHPDKGGNEEDMKVLNKLKEGWNI